MCCADRARTEIMTAATAYIWRGASLRGLRTQLRLRYAGGWNVGGVIPEISEQGLDSRKENCATIRTNEANDRKILCCYNKKD